MKGAILPILMLLPSCSDDFNPVVDGARPYVVFALLNNAVDTQIVRVHATSQPENSSPGFPPVPSTSVSISGPGGVFTFTEVTLTYPPGSSNQGPFQAFISDVFTSTRGGKYELNVSTSLGDANATIHIPSFPVIRTISQFVLQSPYSYSESGGISFRAQLGPETLGLVGRLILHFDRRENGVWLRESLEIPKQIRELNAEFELVGVTYTSLYRRTTASQANPNGVPGEEYISIPIRSYTLVLRSLYHRFSASNLRMLKADFILTQADVPFFTYFSYANFFNDPYTIRVDQPDFSNMDGSLGFFGSLTSDTLTVQLPPDLSPPIQ